MVPDSPLVRPVEMPSTHLVRLGLRQVPDSGSFTSATTVEEKLMRMLAVTLIVTAAILFAGSPGGNRSEAMPIGVTGMNIAADGISPIAKAKCWRWGWHGWGWYPSCAAPPDACVKCQWHWGSRNCWRVC